MSFRFIYITFIIVFFLIFFNGLAGAEVTVFIIDSKIDFDFMNSRIMREKKNINHGSMVARIIKHEAPDAKIIPINVKKNGSIKKNLYYSGLKKIKNYKINNPEDRVLVNISLAFYKNEEYHFDLIKELSKMKVAIISAAGNDDTEEKVYPAGYTKNVISVANASPSGKSSSSNYGEHIDISAKGNIEYINSTYLPWGASYGKITAEGTSFSAPRVTGLMAKLLLMDPTLDIEQVREIILKSSDPIYDTLYNKDKLGKGVINKDKSLKMIDSFYFIKEYFKKILFYSFILFVLTVIIVKFGLVSLFYFLLIILIVIPVFLVLSFQLIPRIYYLFDFSLLEFIYIFTILFITYKWTSWDSGFLLLNYIIGLIIIPVFVKNIDLDIFHNRGNLYISTFYFVLLILYERWKISKVDKINDEKLINFLDSYSHKVRFLAKNSLNKEEDKIKSVLIDYINRKNNLNENIIDILLDVNNPPLALLINKSIYNPTIKKILVNKIKTRDNLYNKLINYMKIANYKEKKIIKEILKQGNPEIIIDLIKRSLKNDNIDKYIALEVLEEIGLKSNSLSKLVKNIFKQSKEVWVQYQALRTLISVHPDPPAVLPFIENIFRESNHHLIKIEAKGLIQDIKQKVR
ncbi:MAG: S8 family serine peptidase [archaeon]